MTAALGSGGRDTGGAAYRITMDGIPEALAILTRAGAELRGMDRSRVYTANSMLRAAAGQLAEDIARTTVRPLLQRGPAPQSAAMADTLRAKVDRMPVIIIGARNPRLSGWRRGAANRRYRASVAWGVERGPAGPRNYYRIPRSTGGHVIGPNMGLIEQRTVPRYRRLVALALESAGV